MKSFFIKNKKGINGIIIIILLSATILIIKKSIANEKQEVEIKTVTRAKVIESNEYCPAYIKKIKIATCPTFYKYLSELKLEDIEIIYTNSTSESLNLLKNKEVDYVLAGRVLKPEENFNFEIIGDSQKSYSFLSKNKTTININDINNYYFYTDLNVDIIINNLNIINIKQVEDVYKYKDQGIIITSWDNTDLNKAEIVQLINNDGERIEISRLPIIYFDNNCDQDLILNIKNIITKKYEY